jgi:hypothetical protein
MEVWFLTSISAVGLIALLRNVRVVRSAVAASRRLPIVGAIARRVALGLNGFGDLSSRLNGRLLAVGWLLLLALAIGDGGMTWYWPPVVATFLVLQQIAGAVLIPWTAALYLYKDAVPHIPRDEADERERLVQGDAYRGAHLIVIGGLAIACALLIFNPAIGSWIMLRLESQNVELIDLVLPLFLLLFLMPSVAYAWSHSRRPGGHSDAPSTARMGSLARLAAR